MGEGYRLRPREFRKVSAEVGHLDRERLLRRRMRLVQRIRDELNAGLVRDAPVVVAERREDLRVSGVARPLRQQGSRRVIDRRDDLQLGFGPEGLL